MFKDSSIKIFYFLLLLLILSPFTILNYSFLGVSDSKSSTVISVLADSDPDVDIRELPDIPYDELNEMWYDPKIEMLIITPDGNQAFVNACKPLMDWKNEKGVKTIILSNFSQYPGRDNPERIRNMIKSYYETENIKWVLLAGDAQSNLVPIRYVLNPDVQRWGGAPLEVDGGLVIFLIELCKDEGLLIKPDIKELIGLRCEIEPLGILENELPLIVDLVLPRKI